MMNANLPELPLPGNFRGCISHGLLFFSRDYDEMCYQRALAAFWESRTRVAVDALDCYVGDRDSTAAEALALIGPLPPAP